MYLALHQRKLFSSFRMAIGVCFCSLILKVWFFYINHLMFNVLFVEVLLLNLLFWYTTTFSYLGGTSFSVKILKVLNSFWTYVDSYFRAYLRHFLHAVNQCNAFFCFLFLAFSHLQNVKSACFSEVFHLRIALNLLKFALFHWYRMHALPV